MVGRERYRIQEGFEDSPLSPCSRRADGQILATSSSFAFAGRSQLSEGSMTLTIAGAALTARPPMMDSQRSLEDEISQRLVRKRPPVFRRAIFEKSPRAENEKSSPFVIGSTILLDLGSVVDQRTTQLAVAQTTQRDEVCSASPNP